MNPNKKVLLLETWKTNIGNAFIDDGSEEILRRAGLEVIRQGGLWRLNRKEENAVLQHLYTAIPSWAYKLYPARQKEKIREKLLKPNVENFFDFSKYIEDVDYVCLSGCVLGYIALYHFSETLFDLKKRGVKIIFNGVGADRYTTEEFELITTFLKKLKPDILTSRDVEVFRNCSPYAQNAYNGIDCGFFISDIYGQEISFSTNYIIWNFDKVANSKSADGALLADKFVIATSHSPYQTNPRKEFQKRKKIHPFIDRFFVSDRAEDYYLLYSRASKIYTDRVHACVAAIAFNVPYEFHYETKRALLLERVKGKDLCDEKERLINFIKEAVR